MKMVLRGFCLPVCCLFSVPRLTLSRCSSSRQATGGSGETVTTDFNHDGKADLASASGSEFLGNGDGTFTARSLSVSGTHIATAGNRTS